MRFICISRHPASNLHKHQRHRGHIRNWWRTDRPTVRLFNVCYLLLKGTYTEVRYEVVSIHDLPPLHGTCSAEESEDGYNCSHKCLAEGLQNLCGCTDFTKGNVLRSVSTNATKTSLRNFCSVRARQLDPLSDKM